MDPTVAKSAVSDVLGVLPSPPSGGPTGWNQFQSQFKIVCNDLRTKLGSNATDHQHVACRYSIYQTIKFHVDSLREHS